MKLLDMMYEQAFSERMAAAEAHGALVRLSKDLAEIKDYDTSFLAWLLTGSHDWSFDESAEWTAEDYDAFNY